MPATEPPHLTTDTRDSDPNLREQLTAPAVEGSYRTLVQKFEAGAWGTTNVYPGDWALQWECVARDERRRIANNAEKLRRAKAVLDEIFPY